MKKNFLLILGFLTIIVFLAPLFSLSSQNLSNVLARNELKTSAVTEINMYIIIDDSPGSLTNWTWAKDQGYCTGAGTAVNPYVISDKFFNTSSYSTNCLDIRNSRKHFIIEDSKFKGSTNFAGIRLTNTTNGIIRRNQLYRYTGALLWIYNSSFNAVNNNNVSTGFYYGILIDGQIGRCSSNEIFNNIISLNLDTGIELRGDSKYNKISTNVIYNNSIGIGLLGLSFNNTIYSNRIRENLVYGLRVESNNNKIYRNCFINNVIQASDFGVNNEWDFNSKGNYWDDYNGTDLNNDGIGDIPYNISGSAGNKDYYPLMSCPLLNIPGGISGYSLIILFSTGTGMIIAMIYLSLRKKSKLASEEKSS